MYYEGFSGFIFVIDTDRYAGSFERPLTAFCTGQVGECEVGQDQVPLFEDNCTPELSEYFDSNVAPVPDEYGCIRPTSIWKTPGYWNDGHGNTWPDSKNATDPEVIAAFNKSIKQYSEFGGHPDDKVSHCPAYNSVAIFFSEEPNEAAITYIMKRAPEFFKDIGYEVNIDGYRIIKTKMVEEIIRRIDPKT